MQIHYIFGIKFIKSKSYRNHFFDYLQVFLDFLTVKYCNLKIMCVFVKKRQIKTGNLK